MAVPAADASTEATGMPGEDPADDAEVNQALADADAAVASTATATAAGAASLGGPAPLDDPVAAEDPAPGGDDQAIPTAKPASAPAPKTPWGLLIRGSRLPHQSRLSAPRGQRLRRRLPRAAPRWCPLLWTPRLPWPPTAPPLMSP